MHLISRWLRQFPGLAARVGLPLLLLTTLTPASSHAQQVREILLRDLPQVQQTYGADSLRALLGSVPIWLVNEPLAFQLLRAMPVEAERYSWQRDYLKTFSQATQAPELAQRLQRVLLRDVAEAERLAPERALVPALDEELLLTLLYQQHPTTEALLQQCLARYEAMRAVLDARPKPNFIQYFFNGLGDAGWSLVQVDYIRFQLLAALNRISPERYPAALVAAQRARLHVPYKNAQLPPTPSARTCSNRQQLAADPVRLQGVIFPRQCTRAAQPACRLYKLVESAHVYFVAETCPGHGFGGFGNIYLVREQSETVELCYVAGWKS